MDSLMIVLIVFFESVIALAMIQLLSPYKIFVAVGSSMGRKQGYLAVGYGKVPEYISVGDIVAFKARKKSMMHRVIDISKTGAITIVGDNRPNEKDVVSLSDIQFKVLKTQKIF